MTVLTTKKKQIHDSDKKLPWISVLLRIALF